jgi:ATP phosphoribosyltransferase
MPVSARLIVNRATLKTDPLRLSALIDAFRNLAPDARAA